MNETKPKVRLICRPELDWDEIRDYLLGQGGTIWADRVQWDSWGDSDDQMSDAEALVEFAGRLCYKSWAPGLNPNVTKVRTNSGEYLENILKSKHGSVLEHANFTFIFEDVSRVFTHELVRHRAGVAISQESLRYVRLQEINFRIPDILEPIRSQVVALVEHMEEFQRGAAEHFGLDEEGVPFHYKKEVTSALRRLASLGLSTQMVWTANIRTLRHVIENRTAPGAEEEIKEVFSLVAEKMLEACPLLFADFKVDEKGTWVPGYSKV